MNTDTGVYTITSPSGKVYVGSAVSFRRRWAQHINHLRAGKHHNRMLQRAHDKYGAYALVFAVVARCERHDLIRVEQEFIDRLNPAYNVCRVAGSSLGVKLGPHSEEHRRKIGDAHRGAMLSDEARAKIGAIHRGKRISEEHRRRVSEANAGKKNHFYGKKHSAAALRKVTGDNHHSAVAVFCVETGRRFPSVASARQWLRDTGKPSASASPILECCRGVTRYSRAYGYTWMFAKDYLAAGLARSSQMELCF